MGWLVKQYPDGCFGLWSSVTDSYIVRKCTREHMIQAIEKMWIRKLTQEVKELRTDFPGGWVDKDTQRQIRKEKKDE